MPARRSLLNIQVPSLSKSRVNAAGERLVAYDWGDVDVAKLLQEMIILVAWRAQHAYPIRLVIPSLRNWTANYSTAAITPAERLKRVPQIVDKLRRHPGMKLSRMQDIGGARAILASAEEVERVHRVIAERWKPVRTSDYRREPRDTGYRGLHLMVEKRRAPRSDEQRVLEIQLRTLTEHRWAETVMQTGNRLGHDLRDGQGPAELVEYFRLASDVLYAEDYGEPLDADLRGRFRDVREQVRPYFERT
jgi:hypothetical protein